MATESVLRPGELKDVLLKEIEQADNPEAERARLAADYRNTFANPYRAEELGYIDEIIRPEETRPRLIEAFEMLEGKRETNPPRKHGNIPL